MGSIGRKYKRRAAKEAAKARKNVVFDVSQEDKDDLVESLGEVPFTPEVSDELDEIIEDIKEGKIEQLQERLKALVKRNDKIVRSQKKERDALLARMDSACERFAENGFGNVYLSQEEIDYFDKRCNTAEEVLELLREHVDLLERRLALLNRYRQLLKRVGQLGIASDRLTTPIPQPAEISDEVVSEFAHFVSLNVKFRDLLEQQEQLNVVSQWSAAPPDPEEITDEVISEFERFLALNRQFKDLLEKQEQLDVISKWSATSPASMDITDQVISDFARSLSESEELLEKARVYKQDSVVRGLILLGLHDEAKDLLKPFEHRALWDEAHRALLDDVERLDQEDKAEAEGILDKLRNELVGSRSYRKILHDLKTFLSLVQ